MLYVTFRKAKEAAACMESYRKMGKALGGIAKYGKDTPIPLTKVIEVCGLNDAVWALQCTTENSDKLARLFACDCAERVLPIFERRYPDDKRPRTCIEVSRRYAIGQATDQERDAARAAARAAARDAARAAAWDAAWDAEIEWQQKHLIVMLEAKD
jgi:hypothetical protein